MTDNQTLELKSAIHVHMMLEEYRDQKYIAMIQQINTRQQEVLRDDMGSKFIRNCGRDIAGEVVRNCFDTSQYNITVDQLAERILKFDYENEYDPLAQSGSSEQIRKNVLNYNELHSGTLDKISADMAASQRQLFPEDRKSDSLDAKGKKAYRESQRTADGKLYDELTGREGTETTIIQNGKEVRKSDLHADHVQSREAATYNEKYLKEEGKAELKEFWNSADNMQLIHASANTSKGDVRVCQVDGEVVYMNTKDANYDPKTDITYKATPQQLTEATIQQWEKGDVNSPKIQKLIEEGYLIQDDDGTVHVPKGVQKKLEEKIRHSQNVESVKILKNTDYGEVASEAAKHTKAAIGKIIAGQIIYYTAPPLIYEIRTFLSEKKAKLDSVLQRLGESAKRIGEYVFSKIKDIFKNVLWSSIKTFIKSFMDILINLVKATVKKLLKMAKNLVMATVDAVRIIADKNSSSAEKADSVFNLFGVTVTSCVVELLFELAADALHIPSPFDDIVFGPLQILTTIVCTNLTMLILEKADLFDVRFGFKVNAIKNIFKEERGKFDREISVAEQLADLQIQDILRRAKEECFDIYYKLEEIDPKKESVRGQLQRVNTMFSAGVDFESSWSRFTGDGRLQEILAQLK